MRRTVLFSMAVLAATLATVQTPVAAAEISPSQPPLPRECRERDADPEKCLVKDGPSPSVRKKAPASPPSQPPKQPPDSQEPASPKLAPRP
jgi:hypothetical protein